MLIVSNEMVSPGAEGLVRFFVVILTARNAVFICGVTEVIVPWTMVPFLSSIVTVSLAHFMRNLRGNLVSIHSTRNHNNTAAHPIADIPDELHVFEVRNLTTVFAQNCLDDWKMVCLQASVKEILSKQNPAIVVDSVKLVQRRLCCRCHVCCITIRNRGIATAQALRSICQA